MLHKWRPDTSTSVLHTETSVSLQCKSSEFGMAIINQFRSNISLRFSQQHKATRHILSKEDYITEAIKLQKNCKWVTGCTDLTQLTVQTCAMIWGRYVSVCLSGVRHSERLVIQYTSIQTSHPTGRTSKKMYHFYKIIQKQICNVKMFTCHVVVLSATTRCATHCPPSHGCHYSRG
jgi:hypothetical protein